MQLTRTLTSPRSCINSSRALHATIGYSVGLPPSILSLSRKATNLTQERSSNMVARKFIVYHEDFSSHVDYDTDDGFEVFKFQLFSLTSVPPDRQKIIGGRNGGDCIITDDSDLAVVSEELKLVSIEGEDEEKAKEEEQPSGAGATLLSDEEVNLVPIEGEDEEKATEEEQPRGADATLMSDEELARMLQAEEEALMLQHFAVSEQGGHIEGRIRPYITQVCMYEDPVRQEAARKTVPVDELEEKAMVSLAKDGNFNPSKVEKDHAFLLQLLFWFKQSFRWVTAPPCDACGNDTINQGMGEALPSEIQYGATRVEIYRCNACSRITRFPRYNDPLKLVETRRGRCGEWGNCFTLYCRAFGYESRLVLDFTDHVWTECFSEYLGRWMHLDPCEGVYDKPLLYEKGWNKKLNYVFAIAIDGVYDVTKRYTREWLQVLSRRNIATEPVLLTALTNMTKDCRGNLRSQILTKLEERDKNELEALERDLYSTDDASVLLPGRQSGDREWRIARSEIGSGKNQSLGCSSCPLRACVDEHVTRIYNAFFSVLSQLVKNSFPQSKVLDILKFVKGVFVDLKKSPYRTRKVSINPFALHWVQYFDELLDALSLKSEIDADGKVNICLAGESVKTALALPVALDAMVGVINYLNNCDSLDLNSLSLPMMSNRIHSGSVLASGEELPFGIATSAFDGLQSSKWEEPNGGRGGWLLYKLPDGHMHKLVAYDVVSANDAPERDPMDWIVEGSEDGGSTWHVLDKQTSQFFEKRFQRKSFEIKAGHVLCNIFRFRFLSVRDVNSTSRLQLSSINLYTDASSS